MDSYLIGTVLIELIFWVSLTSDNYLSLAPARLMVYGLALLLFYPIAARFARERNARRAAVAGTAEVPLPADAIPVHLPENITVYYRPAPLPRRLAALTLDAMLVGTGVFVWWIAMATVHDVMRMRAIATLGMELGAILVPLGYFLYMESANDGQTFGKRQVGIRAIHESGRALTFGEAFARNVLRPLLMLPPFNLIEAFSIRTSGWRQRLGDLAASSVVIVDPR